MSRIRGTKFTNTQRKTLNKAGIPDKILDNYLLEKQSYVDVKGRKCPNQNNNKKEVWTLINRTSGLTKDVEIGEV